MADNNENMKVVVEFDADVSGLKRELEVAKQTTKESAENIEKSFENVGDKIFGTVAESIRKIRSNLNSYTNSVTDINKRLSSVGSNIGDVTKNFNLGVELIDAVTKGLSSGDRIVANIQENLTKEVKTLAELNEKGAITEEMFADVEKRMSVLEPILAKLRERMDDLASGKSTEKYEGQFEDIKKVATTVQNEYDKLGRVRDAYYKQKYSREQIEEYQGQSEAVREIATELDKLKKKLYGLTEHAKTLTSESAKSLNEEKIIRVSSSIVRLSSLFDTLTTTTKTSREEIVKSISEIYESEQDAYNERVANIKREEQLEKERVAAEKERAADEKERIKVENTILTQRQKAREQAEKDAAKEEEAIAKAVAAAEKEAEAERKKWEEDGLAAYEDFAKQQAAIQKEQLAQFSAIQKRTEDEEKAAQAEIARVEKAKATAIQQANAKIQEALNKSAIDMEKAKGKLQLAFNIGNLSGAQKAENTIEQLSIKMASLREGMSQPDFGLGGKQDAADLLLKSVQDVNAAMLDQRQITQLVASEGMKVANGYTTVKDELLKAATALSDLRDKQDELKQAGVSENSEQFKKLSTKIQEAENYVDNLEDALENLKGKPDASVQDGMDAIKKAAADAKWSVESTSQSTSKVANSTINWKNAFKTVGKAVGDSLSSMKKGLSSIGKVGNQAFKKATSGIKGFIENLKKSKHETNLVKAAVKQTEKTMLSLYHLFRARVRRSFMGVVFADVKEYTAGIAQLSPRFNQTVSDIVNSARMFGAQVIAATEPLVTTVGPYIAQFFDLLTGVADKVSQAIAVVTGNDDYIKATKGSYDYAKSLEETEDNTKAVTKATKEYQATVLGFDQLNKLNGNSSSDGGVGGDADAEAAKLTGISRPGFEKAKVQTNKLNDWAKRLRQAIEDGNWWKAGNIMAEGVNKAFSWLEDVAGWSKNAEKFTKIIQNFIDFVNGFIDGLDPQVIGHAIGDVLNTVINFFDMITDEEKGINALQLGEKIGATLLEAIRTIEWETLGRAVINGLEKMVDFVNGIISTEGLFEEIGNSIAEFLNGAIDNFDPDKWSNAVSGLINGFFTVLKTAFGGEEGKKRASTLGTKVGTTIADIFKKINTDDAVEAIKGVSDSIRAFLGNSLNEILTGAVENFEPEKAADVLATLVNNFFGLLSDIFGDTDRAEEFGAKLGTMFSEFFNDLDADTIVNGANAVINSITGAINSFIDKVEWDSVLAKLEDVLGRINWGGLGEILAIIVGPKLLGALGGWLLSNIPKFIGFKMLLNAFKGGGGGIGGGASGGLFGIFNTAVDVLVNGFHWFGDKATKIFGLNGTVAEVLGKVGAIGATSVIAYEGTKKGGNIGLDIAVAIEKAMNGGKLSEEREQQLEYIKGYDHPLLGEISLAVLKIKDSVTGSHDYEKEVLNKTDEQIEKEELLSKSFDELKDDVAKNGGSKGLADAISEAWGNTDNNRESQKAIEEIVKSGEYSREQINDTIKTLMQDESGVIGDAMKGVLASVQLREGVETNGGSTELVSDLRDIFLEYSSSAERLEHMAELLESGDYSNEEFARTLQTMLNIDERAVDDDTKSLLSEFMGEHGLQVEFDPSFTYGIESLSELPNKLAETINTMIADSKLDTSELSTMFNDMNREDLTQTLVDMTKNGQLGEDVQKQLYDYLVATDSDNQRLLDLFAQNQTAGDGMVSALDTGVADIKSEMQTNESTKSERESALRESLGTWFTGVLDKLESIYSKNNEVVVNLDGEHLATAVHNNQERYDKRMNPQPAFY